MISGDNAVINGKDGPFAQTLTGLSAHWDKLEVICPGPKDTSFLFTKNIRIVGLSRFKALVYLIERIRKDRPDLIVTHDYGLMFNGIIGFLVGRFYKIPHFSEIHHLEGYPIATNLRELFYRYWGIFYLYFVAKNTDAIRLVSNGDLMKLLLKLHIPRSKILLIRSIYINRSIYHPKSCEKKYDLLFTGRFVSNKGIFTILEAFKLLRERGYKLTLLLKGNGPLFSEIKRFLDKNHLSSYVQINRQFVTESEMAEIYRSAKLLLCASSVEGGPRVTIESMACGTPTISTRCGIMPEVITNNGFLFDGTPDDLANKIITFISNTELQASMARECIKIGIDFDHNEMINNYAQTYKQNIDRILK